MRLVVAIVVALSGLAAPTHALDRPVARPLPDLSDLRPVARPDPSQPAVRLNRPSPRPVSGAEPVPKTSKSPEPAEATLALAAREALSEAFPGVDVAQGPPLEDDSVLLPEWSEPPRGQDPSLATPPPRVRPTNLVVVMSSRGRISPPEVTAIPRSVRPVARLDEAARELRLVRAAMAAPQPRVDTVGNVLQSARPSLRPALQLAMGRRVVQQGQGGGICERATIRGEIIAAVPGRGACGIPQAVRVTQVSGVSLSRAARMDCRTARALDDWVRKGAVPAVGNHGGGVVRLEVAAGYACRTRNNRPGARISEHGKGRAIDISGLRLANGETLSVLRDWGRGAGGQMLQAMWRAACGPFGTVLGPNADRYHRDHFHFDTARHRSGSYCR